MADIRYRLLGFILAGTMLGACAARTADQPDENAQNQQIADHLEAAPPDQFAPSNNASSDQQVDANAVQLEPARMVGMGIAPRQAPSRMSTYCSLGNRRGCPVRAARVGAPCQCGSEPGVVMPQ